MNATGLLNWFEDWKSFACRAGLQGVVAAFLLSCAQLAVAIPVAPPLPVTGYLFDETYPAKGATINDSYGTPQNGTTAVGNSTSTATFTGAGPTTSTTVPFVYPGNTSFDTTGNSSRTTTTGWMYGNLGQNAYKSSISGISTNPGPANLPTTVTGVTFATWVNYSATSVLATNNVGGFNNIIFAGDVGANDGGGIYITLLRNASATANDNKVQVYAKSQPTDAGQAAPTATNTTKVSTSALTPGQWNHIAAVFDFTNQTIDIYINGNPAGNFTGITGFGSNTFVRGPDSFVTGTPANPLTNVDVISGRTTGGRFDGLVDELLLWNSPLTAGNIEWLANNSITSIPEPMSSYLAIVSIAGGLGFIRLKKRK